MNRRKFLKVIASVAAIAAAPALAIPSDAQFGIPNKSQKIIGEVTRDITWHGGRAAYFVNYSGKISGIQFYYGDFVDKEKLTVPFLTDLEKKAMIQFRKRIPA